MSKHEPIRVPDGAKQLGDGYWRASAARRLARELGSDWYGTAYGDRERLAKIVGDVVCAYSGDAATEMYFERLQREADDKAIDNEQTPSEDEHQGSMLQMDMYARPVDPDGDKSN